MKQSRLQFKATVKQGVRFPRWALWASGLLLLTCLAAWFVLSG